MNEDDSFQSQYRLEAMDYLAKMDFFTWTRHFHVIRDMCQMGRGRVLEVGTGDGVVRRCMQAFVISYTVMDINERLQPDIVGNLLEYDAKLRGRFDTVVATEVLEHIPFADLPLALHHLYAYLRPGGHLLLTLPHRKGHMLIVTPRQRLWKWRFPVGMTSLSEAWNRFVRGRIWIDPHHYWEIGDGHVRRAHVEIALQTEGFAIERLQALPYCDYWILKKAT